MADGHHLGVHIAHPHQAVALDAVPQVLLHIDVGGVGGGVPDAGQLLVATLARAAIIQIQIVSMVSGLEKRLEDVMRDMLDTLMENG